MRRTSLPKSSVLKSLIGKVAIACMIASAAIIYLSAISCGGGSMMVSSRQLQSIVITPVSADPKNSNGMVQFTAMGTFNMAPMTASTPVTWSLGSPFSAQNMPAGVSVDANGMAQCSGFLGTVMVQAASMDSGMSMSQMNMSTMPIMGTAQLTCP